MESTEILAMMKKYFDGKQPPEVMENFGDQSPRALLKESLDVVEFIVQLEEELDKEIDINELSETLLNSTFRELSIQVAAALNQEQA